MPNPIWHWMEVIAQTYLRYKLMIICQCHLEIKFAWLVFLEYYVLH